MEITPLIAAGRLLVHSYGNGGFTIGEGRYTGSQLLLPDRVLPWEVAGIEDVTSASLAEVLAHEPRVEILLLGCGARVRPAPPGLHDELRSAGIAAEFMDTGAACRTFNVLVGEDRRVAAALIAVA